MRSALRAMVVLAALLGGHAAQAAGPEGGRPGIAAGLPEAGQAPAALDGEDLFNQHCAMCHKPGEVARPQATPRR